MDKGALIAAFAEHLRAKRLTLERGTAAARSGTRVDGGHRPANRGERAAVTAQGYLAAGLGARAAELDAALLWLARLDPGPRARVQIGALVEAEVDEVSRHLLVLPGGDGAELHGVQVLAPDAPLARVLSGREPGDEVDFRGRTWEIVDVK